MEHENDNEIIKKVAYYSKEHIKVHVILNNNRIHNGYITEIAEPEFFIINDRYLGEMPIFFMEVKGVEKYLENGQR